MGVAPDEPPRERLKYCLLKDVDKDREADASPKDDHPDRSGVQVVRRQLRPTACAPEDEHLVVEGDDGHSDHEGPVGPEVLPPGGGDRKGQHHGDVEVVYKGKKHLPFQLPLGETSLNVVVEDRVVKTSMRRVVVRVLVLVSRNHANLADELNDKRRDHLAYVSGAEKRTPWFECGEGVGGLGVADADDEEEVGEVPPKILGVSWVLQVALAYDCCSVLEKGVSCHYVEERKVSCKASPALF